jgi:type IV pilus assembly protein PilE
MRAQAGTQAGRRASGFTLIELMIVVVVIGILSAIAYPSYQAYIVKGNRAEGRQAILAAAQQLERYFTNNNAYIADLTTAGYKTFSGDSAATSKYTLAVAPGAAGIGTSFVITATPNFSDAVCGNLTYNQAGTKGIAGGTETNVAKCW